MNKIKKETIAFLAWRKGFSTAKELSIFFGHGDQYVGQHKSFDRKYYDMLKKLPDTLISRTKGKQMTMLSLAGEKRSSICEFKSLAKSYGLTVTDAQKLIRYSEETSFFPVYDSHLKALTQAVAMMTSPIKAEDPKPRLVDYDYDVDKLEEAVIEHYIRKQKPSLMQRIIGFFF